MLNERMNEESIDTRALDARIVRALEKSPDAAAFIPENFAARMAGRVRVRRAISLKPTHYGRNAMFLSMVALVMVLLVLALGGRDSSMFKIVMEWCLCAQLISFAVWLSMRQWSLR